jgi:hypothetical protein
MSSHFTLINDHTTNHFYNRYGCSCPTTSCNYNPKIIITDTISIIIKPIENE